MMEEAVVSEVESLKGLNDKSLHLNCLHVGEGRLFGRESLFLLTVEMGLEAAVGVAELIERSVTVM